MIRWKNILLSIALFAIALTTTIKPMEEDEQAEECTSYPQNSFGGLINELKILIQLQAITTFINEHSIEEATKNYSSFMAELPLKLTNREFYLVINIAYPMISFYIIDLFINKIKNLNANDRDLLTADALDNENTFLIKLLNLFQELENNHEKLSYSNVEMIRIHIDPRFIDPQFLPKLFAIKLNNPERLKSLMGMELAPISQELASSVKQILENDDVTLFQSINLSLDDDNARLLVNYIVLGMMISFCTDKLLQYFINNANEADRMKFIFTSCQTACILKSKKKIKKLMPFFSINDLRNEKGKTILMQNISLNRNDNCITPFLIRKGANVNIQDIDGNTALHIACFFGEQETISILLKNKANPGIQNTQGQTPLMLIIPFTDPQLIKLLLQEDSAAFINIQDNNKFTALQHACFFKHGKKTIKLLLKKGANANLKDIDGNTSLHLAVALPNTELAQLLLNHGAKVDVCNNSYLTPMGIAIATKNKPLELLLKSYLDNQKE